MYFMVPAPCVALLCSAAGGSIDTAVDIDAFAS